MPDTDFREEESIIVNTRSGQRIHTMEPKPSRESEKTNRFPYVYEYRHRLFPERDTAGSELDDEETQNWKDFYCFDSAAQDQPKEDSAGREDEDDHRMAYVIVNLEEMASQP